jgi:hypothetical protein
VPVDADERRVRLGAPTALFKSALTTVIPQVEQFRVSADGQRFVLLLPVDGGTQPPLRVVMNWPALLEKNQPASNSERSNRGQR